MTRTAAVNGIEICYDTLGDAANECALLVAGFGQQLTDWDDEFCSLLVAAGFFVVRFDNRDAGLSTHFNQFTAPDVEAAFAGDTSSAGYALGDMATDALELVRSIGVDSAHILGVSMGAMVAQLMAITAPQRVKSLVLLSGNTGNRDVGQPAPEIMVAPLPRPHGDDIVGDGVKSSGRWASFKLGATDEALRERVQKRVDRAYDPLGSARQLVAIVATPDRTNALKSVNVPTVIIHGRDDPMVHVSGGEALAHAIPDAELVLIDNLRHDMPKVIWPQLVSALKRNAQLARET